TNDVDGRDMEQAVWSLMNSQSSLSGSGFSWRERANLKSLSNLRALGAKGGVVDSGDVVSAVLRIGAGVGYPVSLKVTSESIYVPFGSPDTPPVNQQPAHLADMVEIELANTG